MTLGWPFSMTATQEFVVPRSMPMIFAMMVPLLESKNAFVFEGLGAGSENQAEAFGFAMLTSAGRSIRSFRL